jgi:hypothetical protein
VDFTGIPVPKDGRSNPRILSDRMQTREEISNRFLVKHPNYNRAFHRVRKYGVTDNVYNAMLAAQNGLCAMCGKPEVHLGRSGKVRPLVIDHDHVTGKVRDLLCDTCNRALGFYETHEFGIHSYLAKWR